MRLARPYSFRLLRSLEATPCAMNLEMIRYYFDMRDGDELVAGEEGLELPSLEDDRRDLISDSL